MKLQNIQQQNTNFRGLNSTQLVKTLAEHPGVVAGLASASVIAQKMVLSASELALGPAMDIGIGKTLTKITNDKEGKINQSSKLQAIRTAAQTIGGTSTGIIIRAICIGAMTALFMKGGQKFGSQLCKVVNPDSTKNLYELSIRADKLGRDIGGALSVVVMTATNFLFDIPIINFINKKITEGVDYLSNRSKKKETDNG